MQKINGRGYALKSASERLLDAAGVSVDRMPMLQVIFDRLAAQGSEMLRQLSASIALFTVDSISTVRIGEFLDEVDGQVVVGIIYAQAWDSRLLVGLDHNFIFALAETLFGGDGTEPPATEKRALSNIELRLAERAFELFGKALHTSFSTVCDTVFKLDRVETRVDFVTLAPRTAFGIMTKMKVRLLGRESEMFVLIPQSALNSIRQELVRHTASDISIRDPRWTKQIQSEIGRTEIAVRGVIEERHFTLGDIAGLEIGKVLSLQATAKSRVKLECNAEPLFWCDLGQGDGLYTLRIDEFVNQEQEFIEDILR
ncbi:flagellar motor switch protein FliM [Beijerinckiaceae bacterium]|nr:flagellar motor switch protein FliM [Beijerinckiaceae bacterium]